MHRLVACALLAACGGSTAHVEIAQPLPPVIAPPTHAAPLFPEDPELDALAPANAAFAQETWTGASEWQQHCREWGIAPSRRDEVTAAVNDKLASRGISLPKTIRGGKTVATIGEHVDGVVKREPLIKLVVCTEGVAPASAHAAFAAKLLHDPRAPQLPLGEPDVAWERVHTTGEVELGFRWPAVPEEDLTRILAAFERAADPHVHAKRRGNDLWWTGLRSPH